MDASMENIEVVHKMENTRDVSISMCRIRNRRVKVAVAKVNQRKLSKSLRCSCHLKYYKQERLQTTSNEEELISFIPWHAIFKYLVPLLIGLLQVEYQNKKESPFDTHPLLMKTFLIAICIYSTILGIKIHTRGYHAQILIFFLLLSGSLSSASLLSILFQRPFLWVLLITWGFMSIILVCHLNKSSVCSILETVAKFARGVIDSMFATSGISSETYLTDRVEGI